MSFRKEMYFVAKQAIEDGWVTDRGTLLRKCYEAAKEGKTELRFFCPTENLTEVGVAMEDLELVNSRPGISGPCTGGEWLTAYWDTEKQA